jgi:regulator of replication initiation timing
MAPADDLEVASTVLTTMREVLRQPSSFRDPGVPLFHEIPSTDPDVAVLRLLQELSRVGHSLAQAHAALCRERQPQSGWEQPGAIRDLVAQIQANWSWPPSAPRLGTASPRAGQPEERFDDLRGQIAALEDELLDLRAENGRLRDENEGLKRDSAAKADLLTASWGAADRRWQAIAGIDHLPPAVLPDLRKHTLEARRRAPEFVSGAALEFTHCVSSAVDNPQAQRDALKKIVQNQVSASIRPIDAIMPPGEAGEPEVAGDVVKAIESMLNRIEEMVRNHNRYRQEAEGRRAQLQRDLQQAQSEYQRLCEGRLAELKYIRGRSREKIEKLQALHQSEIAALVHALRPD